MDINNICPNCSQFYCINLTSSKPKVNLPLFLSCGHSMCESCILNIIKCMEPIQCKVCQIDIDFDTTNSMTVVQNPTKLRNFFPVNMYMVGELALSQVQKPRCKETHDHFMELKAVLKNETPQGRCLECRGPTTKMCQQCATVLCDNCFSKSHKNFVIFRNHELQDIDTTGEPNKCTVHKDKFLEYYCNDCKKAVCMDCMMVGGEKSCKNHNVVSLQEVNGSLVDDLNNLYPQVDETFRRLTKTAVDIGYLLHNYENDTGSATELIKIVANVDQHFSKLLSVVQKHKNEVINIIFNLKCSEKGSLEKAKVDVVEKIKKAKNIMKLIKTYSDPQKLKQANLAGLLDDTKQIVDSAWYLNKDDTNKENLKITVNEDLCTLINDYVHLDGNVKSEYKLYSTKELGEDIEIPPVPPAPVYPPELPQDVRETTKVTYEDPNVGRREQKRNEKQKGRGFYAAPTYRSKSGSVSSLNSVGSESSHRSYITPNDSYQQQLVQPVSPFPDSNIPQQLREGSQELIYISHIVDPHNIFVQRACHQGLVKEMLREFRNAVSFTKPSTNHISLGKTYLAFNKTDNMWQRCRIVGIDKSESNKEQQVEVFYFDFGSVETVSIDRLRLIPAARIQCPYPVALNCSLANCEPKSGIWTSDDSILIQNIIDNKQAVIHIRRIISTSAVDFKLEVDITTCEHGVSLLHALVFHDRAKMHNPRLRHSQITGLKDKPKLHMGPHDFKSDASEPVFLTYVISPDKFFVRKQHVQAVYEKICEDLDLEYANTSNTDTVYLPELGMVCLVNLEKYRSTAEGLEEIPGMWARALVKELPGRGRVRVLLPDVGATLLVHWSALKHIHNKFTAIRAIASECHLAGVTPLNKRWSPASVTLLKRFEGRLLELQMEDNRNWAARGRGSIGVVVYDKSDPDNVICINQEMIKHKFAVTFGVYTFNTGPVVEEQVVTNAYRVAEPNQKAKSDTKKSSKQLDIKISEGDLNAKYKGPIRLEAKLLYYQSPSNFYVSLKHQQNVFMDLSEQMQKYYSNSKTIREAPWEVKERCCVLCKQSQTWRRAVIMELIDDNAKVFYSDFASVETVPLSNLRELRKEFTSCGDGAVKCHVHGIIPAVGNEWPSLTKEFFKELLDAYKRIYVTKKGNFNNISMPVEVWVYHTTQGDALEPNKSEWRCLNMKIVEQGLGVPDKSQTPLGSESDQSDDPLAFWNITGSLDDWLQLEPMPLVSKKPEQELNRDTHTSTPEVDVDAKTSTADSSNVMYISDWQPPEQLGTNEFVGIPTYIDNDGVIYLHDITQRDTLDLIRKALDVRFKGPDPRAKYTKWSIGEPCVALFFLDNKYYRGRVVDVNNETSTCQIQYVDYGNEEVCMFTNLWKSVPLHQIPIQAHRCILNRVRPVGARWDRQTLDYIHKSVVEKQCHIKVTGEPINGIVPIDLKYDKLIINDHLVDFEMAEYTDGSKAVVKKFAPTKKEKYIEVTPTVEDDPDYLVVPDENLAESACRQFDDSLDTSSLKGVDWNTIMDEESVSIDSNYMSYPKFCTEEFTCNIGIIDDINILQLSIIHDDETTKTYEKMFEELQAESQTLPPLNGIFENKACVAIFPEDGQWYRASILQFSEAKCRIKVRYIDYGNIEVISLADTREIKDDWTKLPPSTISAKLYDIQLMPDINVSDVRNEFTNLFLDKGPFSAKILGNEDLLPLVELRNDKNELVYQKLIDDKVFITNL